MDPISNMLNSIKNAGAVKLPSVVVPHSNLCFAVAELLAREGYVASVAKKGKKTRKYIEVGVSYVGARPRVTGVQRLSKPSRRMYMGVRDMRPVRQGYGLLVLSTPKGLMTGSEARKEHVGGEVLFKIW
ncbi:MAG: 30S ribosomal protein S8 [Patescibacteria group bacterium]